MKITRQKLKDLIVEELNQLHEANEDAMAGKGIGSAEMATRARELSRETGADAQEREIVAKLSKGLMAASKKTNIRTGTIGALLKRLFDELGEPAESNAVSEEISLEA